MNIFLGILTMVTALSISAVAIYYSVAGLMAIFAAAAIPIMIMGGVLEVGKLITAVWLHRYWKQATWWLKTYLTLAVFILMFITSMGIFGFLSKAHIEQTSAATEGIAQIERIDQEIIRQGQIITRAETRILEAEASVGSGNDAIQEQIDKEQTRIDTAYDRIEPAIDEQNSIITAELLKVEQQITSYEKELTSFNIEITRLESVVEDYRTQLDSVNVSSVEEQVQPYLNESKQLETDLERINIQANEYEERISALSIDTKIADEMLQQVETLKENLTVTTNKLQSNEKEQIKVGQVTIGVTSDGKFGSNTQRALDAWSESVQSRINEIQTEATRLRQQAQDTFNTERERLTKLVNNLRGEQTDSITKRKQQIVSDIDRIRTKATIESTNSRKQILSKIQKIIDNNIPGVRLQQKTIQETIASLRKADNPNIVAARKTIADLRTSADTQILASNSLIQRLRDNLTVGKDDDVEQFVNTQQNKILTTNNTIDELTEQKYALQADYRKLEAEVGPVKYLAEFVYGKQADQTILEEAVRWVILVIILVFDPLAVLLLIASQYTFMYRAKEKHDQHNSRTEYERQRAQAIVNNPGYDYGDIKNDQHTRPNDDDADIIEPSNGEPKEIAAEEASNERRTTAIDDQLPRAIDNGGDTSEGVVLVKDPVIPDTTDEKQREEYLVILEKDDEYNNKKHEWKQNNPDQSIKLWKMRYIKGKIDKLPWN